jgi:hypothetical protein
MPDNQDTIIIRRGATTVTIPRDRVTTEEAALLEQIAAKGDGPLTQAEAYALKVILQRLTASP